MNKQSQNMKQIGVLLRISNKNYSWVAPENLSKTERLYGLRGDGEKRTKTERPVRQKSI